MPTGEDSWGFASPGQVPVREPEQADGPTRRQSRARRIATPELFNRLSIESASTSWANETTGSVDEKWTSFGLGSNDRRQADLLEAGCTRLLQILDPGTASPPVNALRTTLVAIAEPLMAQVEQLLIAEDTEGAISAQQQLVLRLAQRHLCGRREGWLADGEAESAHLLQQQVSQAVRWQLSAATSEAAVAAGLGPKAPSWLQQAAELTAERGLWDDDDVRRELRAAVFEAFSHSAAAKGRPVAAQKWLRKAVHLIDGMSIAMGGRKTELGAAAHLNLCATLSAGAKHAEAVQHALSAREQLLLQLGILTEFPEQLDEEVYGEMSREKRGQLPNIKDSKIFTNTMNRVRKAVQHEDAQNGSGQRFGQLLAAAYHNCAVQQEALGELPAALASITVAVSLAQDMFVGDGWEEVTQRKQYQRTHRMMRKAALNKPWAPPPAAPPPSAGASADSAKTADQPTAPVLAVQSEPSVLRHRRRTAGSVAGGRRRASPKRNTTGKVALAPLDPGLVHKRQSLEMFKSQGTLRPYTPDAIMLNKPLSTEPPNTPPKAVPVDLSVSADYLSHVLGLGDSEGRPSTAIVLAEAKSQVLKESDKREELASEVRETTYRRSPSPTGRPTGFGTAPLFPPTVPPLEHPPWNRGPGNTNLSRTEFNASKLLQQEQEGAARDEPQGPSWLSQHPSSDLQLAVAEKAGSGQSLPGSPQAKVASEFTSKLIDGAFTATTGSPSPRAATAMAHHEDTTDDRSL
jgi:hypothetical protein